MERPHVVARVVARVLTPTPALMLLTSLALGACTSPDAPARPIVYDLAFHDVTVIDGSGAPPAPHRTVVVDDGTILLDVPAAEGVELLDDCATVVDGGGRWLMPGLWDLHAHPDDPEMWHLDPDDADKAEFMELFVLGGVTGVRDMGGDLDLLLSWRAAIAAGDMLGPQLVVAGPLVDGPEPMWPGSRAVVDHEDGRTAVDELLARGVDFIKVYSLLTAEGFAGVAERANERGVPFVGHVPRSVTPQQAADAGMAAQDHLLGFLKACADPDALAARLAAIPDGLPEDAARAARIDAYLASADAERTDALVQHLAASETVIVPTLVLWERRAFFDVEHPRVAPFLPLMPEYVQRWWDPTENVHLTGLTSAMQAVEQRLFARYVEWARALHEAGVSLLPGTDTGGNPHLFPGFSAHDELELLVRVGLTPLEAIRAGTHDSAQFVGRVDTGLVAVGQRADLLLLDADPSADIRNTRQLVGVMTHGRWIDAHERAARLDALAAE